MSVRRSLSKEFQALTQILEKQLMFKTLTLFNLNFSFFLKSLAYKGQKQKNSLSVGNIDSEYQLKSTIFTRSDPLYLLFNIKVQCDQKINKSIRVPKTLNVFVKSVVYRSIICYDTRIKFLENYSGLWLTISYSNK